VHDSGHWHVVEQEDMESPIKGLRSDDGVVEFEDSE
jgi:hypothetical protein